MHIPVAAILVSGLLAVGLPVHAQDAGLERLLRAQVFNKAFEGFDLYHVVIEDDQAQSDGSREVTAVASGKFFDQTQRIKGLFLIVGERVIGGQVLEGTGLPPCLAYEDSRKSSL